MAPGRRNGDGSSLPSVGRFEAAHGNAKAAGTALVFQAVPDGVRGAEAVPAASQPRLNGKPFTPQTAREAARMRWALARVPDFARQELEFVPDANFAPFDAARRHILAGKLGELGETFRRSPEKPADVSSGVAGVARGWAWLLSFAEFYAVRAAKTGQVDDAERSRRFFKDASIELAKCHELMRAEAAAQPHRRTGVEESAIVRAIREGATLAATQDVSPLERIMAARPSADPKASR